MVKIYITTLMFFLKNSQSTAYAGTKITGLREIILA